MKKNVLIGLALFAAFFTLNAQITATYTDNMVISLPENDLVELSNADIVLSEENGAETYSVSLSTLSIPGIPLPMENVILGGIVATEENGIVTLSRNGEADISVSVAGNPVPAEVSLTEGSVKDGKLYLKLQIYTMLMDINIAFGTKPISIKRVNHSNIITTSNSIEGVNVGTYTIYTLNGNVLKSGQVEAGAAINISSLAKGTYVLNINGETVRFVK